METIYWFGDTCFPKATGKRDHFWKMKAPRRGVHCCTSAMGLQLLPVWQRGTSSLSEQVSQSPDSEGELRAGYVPALVSHFGRQSPPDSRLKHISAEMWWFKWKGAEFEEVSRAYLSLFCSTRNPRETTHLCKTACFNFLSFSSLSPFPCIPAWCCYFKSYNLSFSPCLAT